MKKLFAMIVVCVMMAMLLASGVSASEACSTESVSCARATGERYQGMADLAAVDAKARQGATEAYGARYSGMAAYYSARAAWGLRTQSARYQALADYYANLPWSAKTMSSSRGVAGLYSR